MKQEQRDQIRDGLTKISLHAAESEFHARQMRSLSDRMDDALRLGEEPETPEEPDVPEPDVPTPQPDPPSGDPLKLIIRPQMFVENATAPQRIIYKGQLFHARYFRHFAGVTSGSDMDAVTETICVLTNGRPGGQGPVVIGSEHFEVRDQGGNVMEPYDGPTMIVPGGMRIFVSYARGTMLDFARQLAPDKPTPGAHFDDMLLREFERHIHRPNDFGPYKLGWAEDYTGASEGGQGIEPYWGVWRHSEGGRAGALLEMITTAQRENFVMTDENGLLTWDPGEAYNPNGVFMPKGFEFRDDGKTIGVSYAPGLRRVRRHDAEHLHRAYRAALFVLEITGGEHTFARWYIWAIVNWMAACHLSTAGDDNDVNNSGWWSLERTIEWAREQGPNPKCGRGAVHSSRLIIAAARYGIGGRTTEKLARLFEELFVVSANEFGRSFETIARKTPAAVRETDWDDDDEVALSRELQLAIAMFRDSGRERLVELADKLAARIGPFPQTLWNYTRGETFGGFNPYYEIMTHKDLSAPEIEAHGGGREGLLKLAAARGVEAGGSQPLNSCGDPALWLPPPARVRKMEAPA